MPGLDTIDPVEEAIRNETREFLLVGLSRDEKRVIDLYYFDNLTMKEIGKVIYLSGARVSQIHSMVLARLKERLSSSYHKEAV